MTDYSPTVAADPTVSDEEIENFTPYGVRKVYARPAAPDEPDAAGYVRLTLVNPIGEGGRLHIYLTNEESLALLDDLEKSLDV